MLPQRISCATFTSPTAGGAKEPDPKRAGQKKKKEDELRHRSFPSAIHGLDLHPVNTSGKPCVTSILEIGFFPLSLEQMTDRPPSTEQERLVCLKKYQSQRLKDSWEAEIASAHQSPFPKENVRESNRATKAYHRSGQTQIVKIYSAPALKASLEN